MKKSLLQLQTTSKKKEWGRDSLVELLRRHFGHAHFRGSQLQAIEAVLSGRDCFCLMPTGGGKSMCYQIPALAKQGIVIVVCPLIGDGYLVLLVEMFREFLIFLRRRIMFDISCQEFLLIHDADGTIFWTALMENQVIALKEKKIPAEYLASTLTSHAKNKIYEDLESGKLSLRLLYVTPEMMATAGFMSKLTRIHSRGLLNLIAIDEAHCISTWGHDFRPSYRKLSSLRTNLPGTPILALTATAVLKVQNDVMQSLGMQNPLVLKSSFNRANIYYEVRYKDILEDAYADLLNLFKSLGNVCAIVYCLERTTCDYLSTYLVTNGISCAAYHAGLNDKLRSSVLNNWLSARIHVVVATVAFGDVTELYRWFCRMGIDRKDVRLVCHFNIPKSMEAFYQESGRSGRDQLPCRSILYYGINDRKRMEFILGNAGKNKSNSTSQDGLSKKSLADFTQMVEYCERSDCRRKKILESFGEQVSSSICKNSCDTCEHPSRVTRYLEELTTACATRQRNSTLSHIMMKSSDDFMDEDQSSEFWNRADEASCSEEDISDSDDIIDDNCPTRSNFSSASELNDRLEFLQRAEEKYYKSEASGQQMKKLEKNAISKELRDAQKQRLSTAISQALHRLGPIRIELVTSACILENECFHKYGKSGKSFYLSQVASTTRWLLTTDSADLMNRLETKGDDGAVTSSRDHGQTTKESKEVSFPQSDSISSSQIPSRCPFAQASIPSFSQFIKRRKADELKAGDNLPRRPEKKKRL